jgi:hypothetical protein
MSRLIVFFRVSDAKISKLNAPVFFRPELSKKTEKKLKVLQGQINRCDTIRLDLTELSFKCWKFVSIDI